MVDNEEALDVDIVDITNPKRPSLVAEYNLAEESRRSCRPPRRT